MYSFDKIIDRRKTASLKWDIKKDELPMWVADMDFEVLPEIKEAILKRAENGIYGYNIIPNEFYEAYINWWKKEHNFIIDPSWLIFSTGVVPSISSIVRRLTRPAEKVLIQTPVYNIFFNSIYNNGRYILESPLKYENHSYYIDFNDLEEKLSDPQTTLMILCNPHNPIGKIWSCDELTKIVDLCFKYNVKLISDEIHCDITSPKKSYIPLLSVSPKAKEIGIALVAPTKAFNIAGIQTSALIISNDTLRHYVNRGLNNDEIAEPNTFAIGAACAAFNYGHNWNLELREYIEKNKEYVISKLKATKAYPIKQDATYLMWIDISQICDDSLVLRDYIRKHTGLYLSDGASYGNAGRTFLRMNVATPYANVVDGTARLIKGIKLYLDENKGKN